VRYRGPFVLAATAAGLTGILSYHTHPTTLSVGTQSPAGGSAKSSGGSGSSGSGTRGSASGGSDSGSGSGGSGSGGSGSGGSGSGGSGSGGSGPTTTAPAAGAAPNGNSASGSGSGGASGTQTATGPTVGYGYGQLAVRVTVAGGRITDVTVPVLQVAEYTSQYIAQQAIPMLKGEVLSAQSANIQGVSGATYTSQAYDQSLQSALNKVKLG
jgi:uncharacterized protein with FMN-binding domain